MPITDLTGYTWVGNHSISITTQNNATYNINGEGHFLNNQGQVNGQFTSITMRKVSGEPAMMLCNTSVVYAGSWNGPEPFTIQFTGGTDATNSTLIAWLEANGTLTAPIQANTYAITHTLTNLTKSNMTFTIVADNGYALPSSSNDFTITNGSIVSYDNTTGVLVVNGNDNTTISCECGVAPSGITISITNDTSYTASIYDGQDTSGNYLGGLMEYMTNNFTIISGYVFTNVGAFYEVGTNIYVGNPAPITEPTELTIGPNIMPGPPQWQD